MQMTCESGGHYELDRAKPVLAKDGNRSDFEAKTKVARPADVDDGALHTAYLATVFV